MAHTITCRHCGRPARRAARGLCWDCYHLPAVRALYRPLQSTRRGVGLGNLSAPPPPTATDAMPGTEAKLRVLEQRAADGYSLWHGHDAGMGSVPVRLHRSAVA